MAENVNQGKRKLEEQSSVNAGSKAVEDYDSDEYDHDMYVGNRRMNREVRKEYNRQVKESEGFDITLDLDLGVSIGAPLVPARGEENNPMFTEISCLALDAFNSQNNKRYKFVENVTVNTSLAAGYWCRNTFLAKDSDAPYTVKTFQARGFWGICGERIIAFCRLKKTSSDQGDEYPPYSNADLKARQ
ncbi:uncharacterized protein LOC129870011 [Solanum dulcamara]|uniref:uncharacterized protein LOC129870011 n=1 Tax=Solanum dulcamara TaxID=45834 RepID=UPI002485D9C3|nr:uncharacterized protein LOC129870011 [Solanum dulcamara]